MSTLYFVIEKRTQGVPPGSYFVLGMGGMHTLEDVCMVMPKELMSRASHVWMQYPDHGIRNLLLDKTIDDENDLTDFAQAKIIAIKYGDYKGMFHNPL